MPGLLHITLTALLLSCDAFGLASSQRVIPFGSPAARLLQDEGRPHFIQELVRTKRRSLHELVRAQPHLVHDMGWPEVHETSRAQSESDPMDLAPSASQDVARTRAAALDENKDVQDEMERMVHLVVPQDAGNSRETPGTTEPDTELLSGPGAGDASHEASGFYGTDTEDREGGEDRGRRGGEDEWEERERRRQELKHATPDLDALIGYSPAPRPSSSKLPNISASEVPEHLELWEAEGEEEAHSSGYGAHRSNTTSTAAASEDPVGTATPETDTGTNFALLRSSTKEETKEEAMEREEDDQEAGLAHVGPFTQNPTVPEAGVAPSREPLQPSVEEDGAHEPKGGRVQDRRGERPRSRHVRPLTTGPSPAVGFTEPSWDWLEETASLQTQRSEVRGGGVTEVVVPDGDFDELEEAQQVVCVDWSELAGRGYVILNMTKNLNCEEFRADQGVRLLKIMERVFARRMNSPEGSWVLYLSKPTHQQHQLLMNVASEHGVIATKDVLGMLGEIRKGLNKVGIQNYSAAGTCQSRPSQTRSDYGKLFVVLVIIGSVCMVIITSGFIYICWQRRLPAAKTTFRAEELHFVENGCHDNPTLDVTNDSQPEMRQKKPSANGLAGGGEGGGEDGNRWQVFVNQAATEEEEEEQDTHL